ncbi:hypothetical protein GWI33_010368 [Rhynchophorus ferrugineus]|uniref:Uncharacterized protein n=1 Tax=Rhynchophorus ferrugineus TaxID=354439 RepID=A0A834ICZ5_RHYFE|nr:hypothetical protein GWI33_010368 [Rhynchophorus ferrugineus]
MVDGRIVIPITEAPNPTMALLQPSKCHRDAVPARSGGDCILCLIDKLLSWIFLDVKRREAQGRLRGWRGSGGFCILIRTGIRNNGNGLMCCRS